MMHQYANVEPNVEPSFRGFYTSLFLNTISDSKSLKRTVKAKLNKQKKKLFSRVVKTGLEENVGTHSIHSPHLF